MKHLFVKQKNGLSVFHRTAVLRPCPAAKSIFFTESISVVQAVIISCGAPDSFDVYEALCVSCGNTVLQDQHEVQVMLLLLSTLMRMTIQICVRMLLLCLLCCSRSLCPAETCPSSQACFETLTKVGFGMPGIANKETILPEQT